MLPTYSQRRSSLLELPAEFDVDNRKKRVEFEIGDGNTPIPKRSLFADAMRVEVRTVPETGILGLADIESLARVWARQTNIPKIGAAVQNVLQELPSEFRCSKEARMRLNRAIP